MYSRTMRSDTSGPVRLIVEGEFSKANVTVGLVDQAEIILTAEDETGREMIDKATLRSGSGEARFFMPFPEGGVNVVSGRHVSVQANVVYGSIHMGNGDIYVDGNRVSGVSGNVATTKGVKAVIRLPRGSSLECESKASSYSVTGDELADITFHGTSGGLSIDNDRVGRVRFASVSGGLFATSPVGDLAAKSVSGGVEAERLEGDADAKSTSGSVRLAAYAPGDIRAKSVSGSVTILDMANLGNRLKVQGRSVSGSVNVR